MGNAFGVDGETEIDQLPQSNVTPVKLQQHVSKPISLSTRSSFNYGTDSNAAPPSSPIPAAAPSQQKFACSASWQELRTVMVPYYHVELVVDNASDSVAALSLRYNLTTHAIKIQNPILKDDNDIFFVPRVYIPVTDENCNQVKEQHPLLSHRYLANIADLEVRRVNSRHRRKANSTPNSPLSMHIQQQQSFDFADEQKKSCGFADEQKKKKKSCGVADEQKKSFDFADEQKKKKSFANEHQKKNFASEHQKKGFDFADEQHLHHIQGAANPVQKNHHNSQQQAHLYADPMVILCDDHITLKNYYWPNGTDRVIPFQKVEWIDCTNIDALRGSFAGSPQVFEERFCHAEVKVTSGFLLAESGHRLPTFFLVNDQEDFLQKLQTVCDSSKLLLGK